MLKIFVFPLCYLVESQEFINNNFIVLCNVKLKPRQQDLNARMLRRRKISCLKILFRTTTTANAFACTKSIRDLPTANGISVFGTKLALITSGGGFRLHEYIDKRHKVLGPIFREMISSTDIVFVSSPDLIRSMFLQEGKYPSHILPEPWLVYNKLYNKKRGLFFMEGEEWYEHRKIMNQHLLKDEADDWLLPPIQKVVKEFHEKLEKHTTSDKIVSDWEFKLYRLSIDVIISIMIGTSDSPPKRSRFYEDLLDQFSYTVRKVFLNTAKLYGLPSSLYTTLDIKAWREFKDSVDASLELARKLLNEIMKMNTDNNGLISRISKNVTEENLISIVADFVIAAGDTTSYTLLWTLHLLSKEPEICNQMRRNKELIKYVIKESMRLYPVAPFLTRIMSRDINLCGYLIPSGTPIVASIYTSGRDEANFKDAVNFVPSRWDRNHNKSAPCAHIPSASLPFAMGARSCIGRKIAMLQMNETIEMIINNFDLSSLNDTEVKGKTSMVLIPNHTIKIAVQPKNKLKNS